MNGTTYGQLVVFHTIAAEGSIRGAARKLEMAPPSVSQALKLLEQSLGLPLFTRTTRRIELTEAGSLLRERTAPAVTSLAYAMESVRDLTEVPSGRVRLTVPRFAYQMLLKPHYAEFCMRYPNIQLEISISDAAVNLISDGFDVGIRFGDRIEDGMVAKRLTPPMKEALFASPDYLKRHPAPSSPRDLRQHQLVQYRFISSNQLAPLDLMQNGQRVRVEMPIAMIVNDTDLMVDAARQGIGIGRMVEPMVKHALAAGTVEPVLKRYWAPYPGLFAYFAQNSQRARRIRVLLDFLDEKAIKRWR